MKQSVATTGIPALERKDFDPPEKTFIGLHIDRDLKLRIMQSARTNRRDFSKEVRAALEWMYGVQDPVLMMVRPDQEFLCPHGKVFCEACGRFYRNRGVLARRKQKRVMQLVGEET